jgi:hypothetical protein
MGAIKHLIEPLPRSLTALIKKRVVASRADEKFSESAKIMFSG